MASVPNVPIHDWTRVDAGTWHSFHVSWLGEIKRALNAGVLPAGYYADAERAAPPIVPDVVTLQEATDEIMDDVDEAGGYDPSGGGTATAVAADPALSLRRPLAYDPEATALRRRSIAVRHESGDRLVALLELTSPGNKDRRAAVDAFVDKALDALRRHVHVSVVDLLPPRRADAPAGLVGAVAAAAGAGPLDLPPGKPLMVGAFESAPGGLGNLYAEPLAVGDALPNLPLFYRRGRYVNVPLAATYAAAWDATPARWRRVIEA